MSVVDEIKQRLDIVAVIGEHVKLTKAGRNFRALCPFHSEKNPSLYIYPERQSWHCFGACSTGGDVFAFVMKQQGIDFGEALHLLARRAGVEIPEWGKREAEKGERDRLYEMNAAAAQYFHNLLLNSPAGKRARDYLSHRGVSAETVATFQLGSSPTSWEALKSYLAEKGYSGAEMLSAGLLVAGEAGKTRDRFRNKLMFPICDTRGRITGFGARVLDDSLPKYINSPQTPVFDKSGSLYGINLAGAAIRKQDTAVIVEGYMDVITAHQNGFQNVIASMGIAITEKQVTTIKKLTKNLVLALDADTAGEEAMLRCIDYENLLGAEIRVLVMPEGQDPDDLLRNDPAAWPNHLERAVPIVDYTFDIMLKGLDFTSARDKQLATDRMQPAVAGIKDPVRKAHYRQKLAGLVKVSERTIEAALRQLKPATARKLQTTKKEPTTPALKPYLNNRLEAECLTLLLQHFELKDSGQDLAPEYFENTENREIYLAWREADDLPAVKSRLDPALWEHLDALTSKDLPPVSPEERYADNTRRLRERYLRSLETRRAEVFALEAETGGSGADLARLEAEGIEPSVQLREIFTQKSQGRPR